MESFAPRRIALAGIALLAGIFVSSPVSASTIFTTLPYDPLSAGYLVSGSGTLFGSDSWAFAFTPTADYALLEVTVAGVRSTAPSGVTVKLMTDVLGKPGSLLESWSTTFDLSPELRTFNSNGTVSLQSGTQYWLGMFPSGTTHEDLWLSGSGAVGPSAASVDLGSHWAVFPGTYASFELQGLQFDDSDPVPEPATLLLLGTGLASALHRRRRNR